jgi:hypothetical protein
LPDWDTTESSGGLHCRVVESLEYFKRGIGAARTEEECHEHPPGVAIVFRSGSDLRGCVAGTGNAGRE